MSTPTQQFPPSSPRSQPGINFSGSSRRLEVQTEPTKQKSVKSTKSPVTIASGLVSQKSHSIDQVVGSQGLNEMERKKQKLEELCNQMSRRKGEIEEKEKAVGAQRHRSEELESQVRILEEQRALQNGQGSFSSHPGIQNMERMFNEKTQRQNQLEETIEKSVSEMKSRKTFEESEVSSLIKQTSDMQGEIERLEKQTSLAREKAETTQRNSLEAEILQERARLGDLQVMVKQGQNQLVLATEEKMRQEREREEVARNEKTLIEIQRTKSQLQGVASQLKKEIEQEKVDNGKLSQQEEERYEAVLVQIRTEISNLRNKPPVDSKNTQELEKQEGDLIEELKKLGEKLQAFDRTKLEGENEKVAAEIEKLDVKNSNIKSFHEDTENKRKEVHLISDKVTLMTKQVKQLQETNKKSAQAKEEAASHLLKEKQKQDTAFKTSEFYLLQTEISKLNKRLSDEKAEYNRLQVLNREYVPSVLVEQYNTKCSDFQKEVQEITRMRKENELMKKQLVELREEKSRVEWSDNTAARDLELSIKNFGPKKENIVQENKEAGKKLAQSQAKVKEYKESYPDFEIKGEKKAKPDKKKSIKGDEELKELKDTKESKDTKDTKETKEPKRQDSKPDSKADSDKNAKQTKEVPVVEAEIITEDPSNTISTQKEQKPLKPQKQDKPSPVKTSKKQKKKGGEENDEQALIKQILEDTPSEDDDVASPKTASTLPSVKAKKDKKVPTKTKKGNKDTKESKSKVQEDMQFLMQSTKPEGGSTGLNLKAQPVVVGLLVLLATSAIWLLS